jgi:hypothetical protein
LLEEEMGDSRSDRLGKAADVASILALPVAILIGGFGVWATLETRPSVRGALSPYWELVGRWWLPAVVLAAVAVPLIVPGTRRRIVRGWKVVGRGVRAAYLWALWNLVVRPARDHWNVMVAVESDVQQGELGTTLRDALPNLSNDAVQVLEVILDRYDPMSSSTLIRPSFVPLDPLEMRPSKAQRRVVLACDELKIRGFVAGFESWGGKYGSKMVIALGAGLPSGAVLKTLEWVEDEVISRGIPLRQLRGPRVPPAPRQPPTERVRT